MADDIVARLRRRTTWTWEAEEVIDPLDAAAADEIERLRAEVARLGAFLHPIAEKARRG